MMLVSLTNSLRFFVFGVIVPMFTHGYDLTFTERERKREEKRRERHREREREKERERERERDSKKEHTIIGINTFKSE